MVQVGDPNVKARELAAQSPTGHVLLVDEGSRPLAWLNERDLSFDKVGPHKGRVASVEVDDLLRDALSDLLQDQVLYGVAVDAEGRVAGILSVEIIAQFLGDQGPGHIEEAAAAADRIA